jgi:sterol desaturase/sphingolipid hydroxylase (fatty acid hydroxylase superfamily)
LTVVTFLLNWGLYSAAAVVALLGSIRQWGILARFNLPSLALIGISIVTLDLATYLAHVRMHKVPVLWRFHRVHHSDEFVDATTTFRQHPLEGVWRFLWIIVPVWTLGLPALGIAIYRILSAGNGLIEHSNIGLSQKFDRLVSLVWTTPNMHKIHHSRSPQQTDSNYGNLLALCDRAFGTFRPTDEALGVHYGLDSVDRKRSESIGALITLPFESSRTTSASLNVTKDSTGIHA